MRGLREPVDVPIAIDTYRAEVADAALAAGADLVNDHTGLSDPQLLEVVAGHDAGLVLTHLGLAPKQEQDGRYTASFEQVVPAVLLLRRDAEVGEHDPGRRAPPRPPRARGRRARV